MALVPFNRRKSLTSQNSFMNMLDDFFNDSWLPSRSLLGDTFKIDVKETERDYTVEADLPGVEKDEINLNISDGRLTIAIARSEEKEDKDENYIHQERRAVSMQRSVYLADASDDAVQASLEKGVLRITVQKDGKHKKSNRIEIQ